MFWGDAVMMLYHGSYKAIEKPDTSFSRQKTDFGKGFYLTPLKEQAERWAKRFINEQHFAVVSAYKYMDESLDKWHSDIKILEFREHSKEWLVFVMNCRMGIQADLQWDLIIGGVANDRVFDTIQLYFDGLIGDNEAIGRLKYSKPSIQYCFKTQSLIDERLVFVDAEVTR